MNLVNKKLLYCLSLGLLVNTVFILAKTGPVLAENDSSEVLVAQRTERDYEAAIDAHADRIFYERHPELAGSKIRPYETNYAREWQAIRSCEAVVDYIFYRRHPELAGRKIQRHERDLAQEWKDIYNSIDTCPL